MPKKKASKAQCEAYGRVLIGSMIVAFEDAYRERVRTKVTLEGLLIKIDIEAAYTDLDPAIHLAVRHATRSGVKAADAGMSLSKALAILDDELTERLDNLLGKQKP